MKKWPCVWFISISVGLISALPSASQTSSKQQTAKPTPEFDLRTLKPIPVAKGEVTAVAVQMKLALDGVNKLQVRANRYCYEDSTFNAEEKLDQVLTAHILKYERIPASEMLHLVRTGVAIEHEMMSWFGMCLAIGKALEGSPHGSEASSVASDLAEPVDSLEKENAQMWDLLARQIATEERREPRKQRLP